VFGEVGVKLPWGEKREREKAPEEKQAPSVTVIRQLADLVT
jgi:hypothetical protein